MSEVNWKNEADDIIKRFPEVGAQKEKPTKLPKTSSFGFMKADSQKLVEEIRGKGVTTPTKIKQGSTKTAEVFQHKLETAIKKNDTELVKKIVSSIPLMTKEEVSQIKLYRHHDKHEIQRAVANVLHQTMAADVELAHATYDSFIGGVPLDKLPFDIVVDWLNEQFAQHLTFSEFDKKKTDKTIEALLKRADLEDICNQLSIEALTNLSLETKASPGKETLDKIRFDKQLAWLQETFKYDPGILSAGNKQIADVAIKALYNHPNMREIVYSLDDGVFRNLAFYVSRSDDAGPEIKQFFSGIQKDKSELTSISRDLFNKAFVEIKVKNPKYASAEAQLAQLENAAKATFGRTQFNVQPKTHKERAHKAEFATSTRATWQSAEAEYQAAKKSLPSEYLYEFRPVSPEAQQKVFADLKGRYEKLSPESKSAFINELQQKKKDIEVYASLLKFLLPQKT
jgi:hypothetical protein